MAQQTEVWQRGAVEGIPALLQPVAHALLQAREELEALTTDLDDALLWERPAGVASPAFHMQHLSGVLDRVFTYARNEALTQQQFDELHAEDIAPQTGVTVLHLVSRFNTQVHTALAQLAQTSEQSLTDFRGVGRKQLPSTVLGLLFHAAEHTMRHIGQLYVTVKVLQSSYNQ